MASLSLVSCLQCASDAQLVKSSSLSGTVLHLDIQRLRSCVKGWGILFGKFCKGANSRHELMLDAIDAEPNVWY